MKNRDHSQQGSITVFFLLFAMVMIACGGYSFYIGRVIQEKARLENASDFAALSMANHAAQGMNMMAANNLAIAAHLHTASAMTFIGRYWAIVKALMTTIGKTPQYVVLTAAVEAPVESALKAVDEGDYATAFVKSKEITALMTKAASGLTTLNKSVAKIWLYETPLVGLRYVRLNAAGAIAIPMQSTNLSSYLNNGLKDKLIFKTKHLSITKPQKTICHTIQSSEMLGDTRNRATFWLVGMLKSVGFTDIDPIIKAEAAIRLVNDKIIAPLTKLMDSGVGEVMKITAGMGCSAMRAADWGMSTVEDWMGDSSEESSDDRNKADGICDSIDGLTEKISELSHLLELPSFEKCGLIESGQHGEQAKHFSESVKKEEDLGFIFPEITNDQQLHDFEESLSFGIIASKPLFKSGELPKNKDSIEQCPKDWSVSANGVKHCRIPLNDLEVQGLDRSMPDEVYKRTQWSVSFAKASYQPSGDDPTYAVTSQLQRKPDNMEKIFAGTRMQLFWPAWRASLAPVKVTTDIIDRMKK